METTYKKLSPDIQAQIIEDRAKNTINPFRCDDTCVIRRDMTRDKANLWRPAFVRDTEKILHLPVYNRYADKTQVFSFFKNDDITRRALHVQLVSRIARSIGNVLGLNQDLIESISLGHDIGHTPFGHPGEKFLSDLLHNETGFFFNHNVHSVRVLDTLFRRNISLQTLDGILCHNGEFEMQEYKPRPISNFDEFDQEFDDCCRIGDHAIAQLIPSTLEGCVVRVCDMIAYLGKDRQDAVTAKIINSDEPFSSSEIGIMNAAIINNISIDIINNSYGKDFILLSPEYYNDLKLAKKENYEKIYHNKKISTEYNALIKPMFSALFYSLLDDIKKENKQSPIWKHHIDFIAKNTRSYTSNGAINSNNDYLKSPPELIVTDFIASMTDDYFIDLYNFIFPDKPCGIEYKSYFSDISNVVGDITSRT